MSQEWQPEIVLDLMLVPEMTPDLMGKWGVEETDDSGNVLYVHRIDEIKRTESPNYYLASTLDTSGGKGTFPVHRDMPLVKVVSHATQ